MPWIAVRLYSTSDVGMEFLARMATMDIGVVRREGHGVQKVLQTSHSRTLLTCQR